MPHSIDTRLVRGIRRWDGVALVVNSVVGAGIFGLPARVYAIAGPYSVLAYVVCAVPTILVVLSFAELGSRFKEAGGPYLYARVAFGPFAGFEVGWLAWLSRVTALAALCNLFVDYLAYFLPASATGLGRGLTVTFVIAALAAMNLVGIRIAALVTNVFTIGKLVPLLLVVVGGLFFIDPERFSAAPAPGYDGFTMAVVLLFFAYAGFENTAIMAGEAVDPARNVPFSLMTGIATVVLLYLMIQVVCIGIVPGLATSERPLADAGGRIFGSAGAAVVSIGALISVTGTMNAIMLAAPRLIFAMAQQGQLPRVVAATHRRFRTPHASILLTAAAMLGITLTGTFLSLAATSTIIRLLTYGATAAALPVLRWRNDPPAPFVAPAGVAGSAAALVAVVWMLSSSSWSDLMMVGMASVAGALLFVSTRRRSEAPAAAASTVS